MNGQRYGTMKTTNVHVADWARDARLNPTIPWYGTQSIPFDGKPTDWYAPQTAEQSIGIEIDPTLFGDLVPPRQPPLNVVGATRFKAPVPTAGAPPSMGFLDTTFSSTDTSDASVKLLPSGQTSAPRRYQNW
jgi:hypothetical protein